MKEKKDIRIGLLDVLQTIFLVLKLCGLIDWSWWLVLLPVMVEILLGILVAISRE